jgi:hypothetical protein
MNVTHANSGSNLKFKVMGINSGGKHAPENIGSPGKNF